MKLYTLAILLGTLEKPRVRLVDRLPCGSLLRHRVVLLGLLFLYPEILCSKIHIALPVEECNIMFT